MKVVIVESPTKIRTIAKFLAKDYSLLASYGHVRDLPSKNGSVNPNDDFALTWEISKDAQKRLDDIEKNVKKADTLYLATDPDREGEAISWHIIETLKKDGLLHHVKVQRVVFHEITKKAIEKAFQDPRDLNYNLVNAYLARRALDYLFGFTLSPLLWRKLPGSRSAGRVQSVALRLITDREDEIDSFKTQEYWTILCHFHNKDKKKVMAKLSILEGEKLEKFSLKDEGSAKQAEKQILQRQPYRVKSIETKEMQRHPTPPFTTSTLQQEASRKFGLRASRVMQIAQSLYEGVDINGERQGLITYMRTDSTHLSTEAIGAMRAYIEKQYGRPYLPAHARAYKSKIKNAQEAHEAIRPTDITLVPSTIKSFLTPEQFKLYELIWKRALACQMKSALIDKTTVDITDKDEKIFLRAWGSIIKFDGFLTLYEESQDEQLSSDEEEGLLPPLQPNDPLTLKDVLPHQHFTQPPPHYTEASLVKKLEELGIGRPSTWANILPTLLNRSYVKLEKKRIIPEERGRIVTTFLKNYFEQYIQYSFTADLEESLDHISQGQLDWKKTLKDFWEEFYSSIKKTEQYKISDIIDTLNQELGALFFPAQENGSNPRQCPQCEKGELSLKFGKFGIFIGCSGYPDCQYTRKLEQGEAQEALVKEEKSLFPRILGQDPDTQQEVSLRKGPYGLYLQWDNPQKPKEKPRRTPLPAGFDPETITLEDAKKLGALPKELGSHPTTKEPILVGIGRFGPYIKHGTKYTSIPKTYDFLTLTLPQACELIEKSQLSKNKKTKKKT